MDKRLIWIFVALGAAALACTKQAPTAEPWNPSNQGMITTPCPAGVSVSGDCSTTPTATAAWYQRPTRSPDEPILTPTPDQPRVLPTLRLEPDEYYVQQGDSLASIADRYQINFDTIAQANGIDDPNSLSIGQYLLIPAPTPSGTGSGFKLIPDSELVYGPAALAFNIDEFVNSQSGLLKQYTEEVEGDTLSGSQILRRVALDYLVNPRVLLAVLEYTSGWVTNPSPELTPIQYPLRFYDEKRAGLYKQLAWAANQLNRGFYLWQVNAIPGWLLPDGAIIPPDNSINAGTAGIQHLMSLLYNQADWETAVSSDGVFAVYNGFFGYPFDQSIEPILPDGTTQPAMVLPFEPGIPWSFTGGPHGGWGDGSAWAALDFAPPGEPSGCVLSEDWVTAVADGMVVRSEYGTVVQDLDGDGNLQTGWSVLYLHIDSNDRVPMGVMISTGDHIGHPSCEGGVSTATHVHIARRFNGMWVSADGSIPFNLDGWVSKGTGTEYDGYLQRNDQIIEAFNGLRNENQIQR